MDGQINNEKPEVYVLRQDSSGWRISRRDFLKAAGVGSAALCAGLESGCSRSKPLDDVCAKAPSHKNNINHLIVSPDGKYLMSADNMNLVKCWDFDRQSFLGDCSVFYSESVGTGMVHGMPVFAYSDRNSQIVYIRLPIQNSPETDSLPIPFANHFVFDMDENVYIVNGNSWVELFKKEDDYLHKESLYENPEGLSIQDIHLFDHGQRLFIYLGWGRTAENAFVTMDLRTGEVKEYQEYYNKCSAYGLFPNDNKILICNENEYRLVSLESGEALWSVEYKHPKYPKSTHTFYGAAVTSDGSAGVLLTNKWGGAWTVHRISMADGSIQSTYIMEETNRSGNFAGPVFNGDETICAVSEGKTLMFFSLPDLRLLACPVDINESKDNTKGIEISRTDEITGETYTYTMPCGAAIPKGAVCTCNCVTGRGGCSCVGYTSGRGGGGHYWHPN